MDLIPGFVVVGLINNVFCKTVMQFVHNSFVIFTVSGLSGTKEVAQSQVSVGMGLLAGSTVMLITVIWGSCVIVGKCDLRELAAVDGQDTKGFDLTGMLLYWELSYISLSEELLCNFNLHYLIFNIQVAKFNFEFAEASLDRYFGIIFLIHEN